MYLLSVHPNMKEVLRRFSRSYRNVLEVIIIMILYLCNCFDFQTLNFHLQNAIFRFNHKLLQVVETSLPGKMTVVNKGSCQKKKRFFFGYLSQMWVGGVADSQTTPKIALFDPNFTFCFPKSHKKNLGWVHGFTHWGNFPK